MTYGFSLKIPGSHSRPPPQGEDNGRVSGGLPHSEIFGSKPIPGSPKLIAGYHVLHRLLLPRHPPNALLALDPIQRRTGFSGCATRKPRKAPLCQTPSPVPSTQASRPTSPWSEVIQFPAPRPGKARGHWLVYLTWNKTAAGPAVLRPQVAPSRGGTSGSDVSLSSQCKLVARLDGRAPRGAQQSNR